MHTLLTTFVFAAVVGAASIPTRDVSTGCGIRGYDLQNPAAALADYSGAYNTFTTCQAYCTGFASFAFGENACLCYAAPIADNVHPVAESPYSFYNADCPNPVDTTSTTTTTMTTTTTTTTAEPSPVCGANGYDRAAPPAALVNNTPSSFTSCQTYCSAFQSFAFSADTCLCYAAAVAGNLNPVAESPFKFFDASCPAPAEPSTTTTTTTTTTPTTTATTTTTPTTTLVTTTTTPQPTQPPQPQCFQLRASSAKKTVNGDWLAAPLANALTSFTSLPGLATTFSLATNGQLVSTDPLAKRAPLGRKRSLLFDYGAVYTDGAARFDTVRCTRRNSDNVLDCATKAGDATYTLGSLFYVGRSSLLLEPVTLNVVPASCPAGWKA